MRAVCFLVALVAVPWAVYTAMERTDVVRPQISIGVPARFAPRLESLSRSGDSPEVRVAFLGDSTAVDQPPHRAVPARLARSLNRDLPGGARYRVISLALEGLGPTDFYFLADMVVAARPDAVVMAFNAATLSPKWSQRIARPELAGWIRPARVPEALLMPLDWIGLRADQLLANVAIVRSGGAGAWFWARREQARVGAARALVERGIDVWAYGDHTPGDRNLLQRAEARPGRTADPDSVAALLRDRYGPALAGLRASHPALEVVGATVRALRREGAAVVVYFVPMDVELLERVGVANRAGLVRTAAAVESVVTSQGGVFVDMHGQLPTEAFRDPQGHYALDTAVDGPEQLAVALAPALARALDAASSP